MATENQKVTFSDISLVAGTSSNYELVVDEDSINQNILMIVSTPVRSKWWRPEIGSNLNKYLFEPIDAITATRIRSELSSILESNLEYRVIFEDITVVPNVAEQNFYVNVSYRVPALAGKSVDFSFALGRDGGN